MATIAIVPDWTTIEDRSFALFCEHKHLDVDDALLAALVEQHAPEQAARALRLIDGDGAWNFSQAFKMVRATDRYFDEVDDVPFVAERMAA